MSSTNATVKNSDLTAKHNSKKRSVQAIAKETNKTEPTRRRRTESASKLKRKNKMFTYNPQWKELQNETANQTPNLITRIFQKKTKETIKDLTKNNISTTITLLFQQRNLPSAHIQSNETVSWNSKCKDFKRFIKEIFANGVEKHCKRQSILTIWPGQAQEINKAILKQLPGKNHPPLLATDKQEEKCNFHYEEETLHAIEHPELPPYELFLKQQI